MSLSEVPTRPGVSNSRSATNCKAGGIINFLACALTLRFLSSLKSAISISACSSDVSFKSAAVDSSFLRFTLATVGCAVEQSSTPSPPTNEELNALFSTLAAFTCLVCCIDRAKALVYREESVSYKLSSIASSVNAKAKATVSCV